MAFCIGSFCLGDESTTTTPRATPTPTATTPPAPATTTSRQGFFSSLISGLLPTFDTTSTTPSTTATPTSTTSTSARTTSSASTPTFLPSRTSGSLPVITSVTSTVTGTDAAASASSSGSSSSSGGGTSAGAIAGIAIGVIVALIVLAVLIGKFLGHKKRQREAQEAAEASSFDPWVSNNATAAANGGASRSSSDGAGPPLAVAGRTGSANTNRRSDDWARFGNSSSVRDGSEMSYAHPTGPGFGAQPSFPPGHSAPYGQQWSAAPSMAPPMPMGPAPWGNRDAYGQPWGSTPPPGTTGNPNPYMNAMTNPIPSPRTPVPTARPQGFDSLPIGASQPIAYSRPETNGSDQPYGQHKQLPIPNYDQRRSAARSEDAYGGMD